MEERRLVIITIVPFTEFLSRHFGVAALESQGFRVEVWDSTEAFFPSLAQSTETSRYPHSRLRLYSDRTLLLKELKQLGRDVMIIPWVSFSRAYLWFFRGLAKSPGRIAMPIANPVAASTSHFRRSLFARIKKWLERPQNFLAHALDSAVSRLPLWLLGVRSADYLLLIGGTLALQVGQRFVGKSTRLVWTHSSDYDAVLAQGLKSSPPRSIVFIDEYLALHPDFETIGLPFPTTPEVYFPIMNSLFDELERIHGLPVVIAAHPRADCDLLKRELGGRHVEKGATAKLVASSAFVITHASTAIGYAVIFEKPILIVTTRDVKNSFYQRDIDDVARAVHVPVMVAEDLKEIEAFVPQVSKRDYEAYYSLLIKNPASVEAAVWSTIGKELLTSEGVVLGPLIGVPR